MTESTSAPATRPESKRPYQPPKVVWERELAALMQVTQPKCIPGQDPRCTP